MGKPTGEKRKLSVTSVTRRTVSFISPTTGKLSCIERYRVASIKFAKPSAAVVYLKPHDAYTRYPK
jgi:hypothetical protein